MIGLETSRDTVRRYCVYESTAFGMVRLAAEVDAACDADALRAARSILPNCQGDLRQGPRVVCRFGRAGGLMLQS
jgi:hypothetical protein